MKENEDIIIERPKEVKRKPTASAIIGLCALLLIAVMVISAVVSTVSGVSVAEISKPTEKGGVIYDVLPDSIKDIESYSSGLVMLTDTALVYLDSNGKNLSSNSHQYAQPVMAKGGSSVLLYDKGGASFRIEKNTKIYNTYTVSNPITVATVDKNGDYAYVLNEDGGFQSHLYVYSYKGKKLFEWGSSKDYCIGAALSDNGKNIALSMLGVNNGEYVSKVILFNFRNNEAAYTVEFPDTTVFKLEFISGKDVAVFTDNGIYVIDKKGEYEKKSDYSPSEIMHSSVSAKGLSAFATASHGNTKDSVLNVFDKKMNSSFLVEYKSEILGVRASDKFVSVILGDRLETYNKAGEKTGNIVIDEKCVDAAFSGRTLFVFTISGIYNFDAYGEYDLTLVKTEEETGEFFGEDETEVEVTFPETMTKTEETTRSEVTTKTEQSTKAEVTSAVSGEEKTEAQVFG